MGIETEIKCIVHNINKIRDLLKTIKTEMLDKCIETDTYYMHPCRDFRETDEALRIRKKKCLDSIEYYLTYKGARVKRGKIKIREEIETPINDYKTFSTILEKLGFKPILSFSKYRERYVYNNTYITIDHLYGVGWFIEIEGEQEHIEEFREKLGKYVEAIDKTYLEICIETRKCRVVEYE